ncbi:putative ammonium transporter 3 [Ptychodera flava]|uniref:putative ammonium transporter 3 n=1 Tax=Ptychodera flava TaxID=63121 RepID=UPI00396A853F
MANQISIVDSFNMSSVLSGDINATDIVRNLSRRIINGTSVPGLDNHVIIETVHTSWDDATWILTNAFIIFTMQSGFGMLESGTVSRKNEVNIMVKNAVDVLFGGVSYWAFGYGLTFGTDEGSNPFCGVGHFFVDATDDDMGRLFSDFFFHASFATTATTIVSGAMAERTKLEAYIIFSFLNTCVYCFPAHWLWAKNGWLKALGAVDIAGSGAVHLIGGVSGLAATLMLKPRIGRFEEGEEPSRPGSLTNALFGMFMLWWGWLGFNCGSTFGITGGKWKLATRSAVSTIAASIGGGTTAIFLSYVTKRRKFDVGYLINGVLGALVSITALCALSHPWQGLVIGAIGSLISCFGSVWMEKLKIDDPVGVVPVHALSGIWGLLSVGLFVQKDTIDNVTSHAGLFYGGGWYVLGVQSLAAISITAWTLVTSYSLLKILDLTIGIRVPRHEELLGADLVEHSVNGAYDKSTGTLIGSYSDVLGNMGMRGDQRNNGNLIRISRVDSPGRSTFSPSAKSKSHLHRGAKRVENTTEEPFQEVTAISRRQEDPQGKSASRKLIEGHGH